MKRAETWVLTRENLNEIDDRTDADGLYAKGYWEQVDGKLAVTGLRIGTGESRVVACFGDTVVRSPRGRWSVVAADAAAPGGEGRG